MAVRTVWPGGITPGWAEGINDTDRGGAQALPRKGVDNMAIWVKALWVVVSGLAMMVEIDALHSEEGNICKVFMTVGQFIMTVVAVQVL